MPNSQLCISFLVKGEVGLESSNILSSAPHSLLGYKPPPLQPPSLSSPDRQKQRPTPPHTRTKYTPMDSDLQQAPSARALASIEIIDETPNLAGQMGSFPPNAQPFASFRNIDNVAAHNSTRAQDPITLENNVHDSSDDGTSLLPSVNPSFPQSGYDGLAQDPMAESFAGQLQGMKLVPDPPNVEYWRNRLFLVDEMITLSEDEYVGHSSYATSSVASFTMEKKL